MDTIDTGKVRLDIVDNSYIHAVIYSDEEIIESDIKPVTNFLDQFTDPVPALIERQGQYSISVLVQISMMQQTKHRLKAVAYIERNHRDVIMTRIAASTYFRDVEVKSFYDQEEAIEWLKQFFPATPLITETQKSAQV
ncbi:MAG: STAS/SEC14 domain-containing protein [Candidatus Thiodiazotropha sp. (ex Gloverina cf. vestifex)]|nr:STAS/SEC14 domain-containing protein [Candidatus Thiodiazotropha sp. (ex Gloverina cf. vestifex)]